MNPENIGYQCTITAGYLMGDCDGQTFLPSCRKYLTDEVFMKDFDAMKDMCEKIFQFFYLLEMISKEVDYSITESLIY